ncbi:hypothetical protein CSPX01_04486 [Colletotrichum filicis]|nr:hypothetical protein CSPX01_04486 [Colletotrichum filicis]
MSAEDNGQGSRDPLIPRGDNFIPFERSDVRRSRVQEALNQTNVLAPSQSSTQTPPSGRRGIEESPTTGGIAGHCRRPQHVHSAVHGAIAEGFDNEQADFLICVVVLMYGTTAPKNCRRIFTRACDLKQHNWQCHVHINDQHLIAREEAAEQRRTGAIGSRHNARSRGLKPYQSKATTPLLEEHPTYRLTIEGWDHFVSIISMLDQSRPRPEDQHRNHRITCISSLWRSQFGNDRPGFGMQTDISDANKAILNRSIRNAMTFLLDPEGENSSTSFIDDEIYLADQRNNPASQTQQVEHSEGAGAIDVHPTVMEFIHGLSAEECDYYIAVLKLLNIQGTG